jgi:hypothetical protein
LEGEAYATEQALEVAGDETRDVWSREAALLLLGRLGGMRAPETIELLKACADPDQVQSRIQLAAVTALGALGADGGLPGGGSLTEAEQSSVVEWLLACVRNPDAAIDVRVAVGEALSMIHSAAPDDAIVDVLVALARAENGEERPPYSVQIAAAKGLTSMLSNGSDPGFVEQLLAIAGDAEINDAVRTPLAEALGGSGAAGAAAAEAAGAEAAAEVLLEIVHDPKVYAPGKRAALDALGRVGHSARDWSAGEAILDQVVKIAQTKERTVKDFVRLAAARALSGLGHVDLAIQHMIRLIADKSLFRSTRNDALGFLAELGSTGEADLDAAVVAVLQIWLNEENTTEDVRENAIESLRVLHAGQVEVIRDMIAVIQNKGTYPRVRRVAAAQLGRFPVEQKEMVVEALSPVFYDPEEKSDLLRVPIARMLFLWGEDEQALAYLRLAAEQSYMAQVRYNASMILLEIGEVGLGTVELLRLAQNPDISDVIRSDAARALGLWQVGNQDVAGAKRARCGVRQFARDHGLICRAPCPRDSVDPICVAQSGFVTHVDGATGGRCSSSVANPLGARILDLLSL